MSRFHVSADSITNHGSTLPVETVESDITNAGNAHHGGFTWGDSTRVAVYSTSQPRQQHPSFLAPIPGPNLDYRHIHGDPMASLHVSAPLNIDCKDEGGNGTSRLIGNNQVQAFPNGDTAPVQIHHQTMSIDRVPSAPTRNEGNDKPPVKARSKERKFEQEKKPSHEPSTSAKGIPISRPDIRNVPRAESSANALPTRTHQSHRALASTSTAQLPSTSETPTSIVVIPSSVAAAGGVTMAATQPVHPTLATMAQTAAISADQPEKPSRKRKKNQASAADEGGKPVKKPRKKKGEVVESRTKPGLIEGESGLAEKRPRKKKNKKVDGEVITALESGMVQLNVQDAASRNADVEPTSTAVTLVAHDKNVRTEVTVAEERGKVEEKKTSGRGRKRKKPGDEGGSSSSQKKKKVKLEDEEMGGDEGGNDEMDDPISGNNAITGEWARKRTRTLKSNVKWTVFSGPKTDENFIITKPTKVSRSKRVASSSVETTGKGFIPERILRPNIWAASKSELVFVLPELSQSRSHNGVTESSSNFPMVLLDESTAGSISVQVEKLGGDGPYGLVRLTLVRDFVCPLEELAGSECNFASGSASVSNDRPAQPQQQEEDAEDSGLEYIDEPMPSTEVQPSVPESENGPGAISENISVSPAQQQPTMSSNAPGHSILTNPGPSAMTLVSDSISASLAQQQPTMSSVPPSHTPSSAPLFTHQPAHLNPIFGSNTPIPRTLSPEIDILTSTSNLSLPIILISSKEVFNRAFSSIRNEARPEKTGLGEEHAYVFWGFFKFREGTGDNPISTESQRRIVGVWWEGKEGEEEGTRVGGRVEWVFDLEWVPGWDGSNNENVRPWWADVLGPSPPEANGKNAAAAAVDYSEREKAKWMNLNLLPAQIADGQEEGSQDEAMPRGWLCKRCGRLNRKVMMRHRWCGGVALGCRDNPVGKGYAVELWDTRDPRQTASAFPINVCDERRVDVRVADWDDGMRTLKYRPMTIALRRIIALQELGDETARLEEVDGKGILKHVFTCNSEELQREATPLFSRIQRDVCLSKKIGDSGPYFKCDISDSYASKRDKYAFSCMTWENAPQVVRDAQDLMVHMGRSYGEDQDFVVDWLTILGWISSGNRKTSEKLSSKDRTVAMMCLGNDVILTITPKWEIEEPPPALNVGWEQRHAQSTPTGTLGTSFYPVVSGNVDAGVAAETQASTRTHNNGRPISAQTGVPAGKKSRVESAETMSVTVVHGDMLLFSGCDFEYSIKRLGTSILLVGGKA